MKRFDTVLQRALGVTSAIVLFAMMLITAVDVAGRYLFNKPIAGGFELTEILLAALIYCGLPLVSARREHIVIDTFDPMFSLRLKRILDMVAEVVCAIALAGVGWLIFVRAGRVNNPNARNTIVTSQGIRNPAECRAPSGSSSR